MNAHATVPFVDLSIQWNQVRADVMPDVERLFEANAFCLGPWASEFERRIADYLGARHAVAVSSGSAALHLAVIAAGIRRGDKVLVPAHTFIGTVWGLLYEGAIPVFCDVEPATGTIDLADAERRLDDGVRAIIPVHLYGQPADMSATMEFARRHNLTVIEDVAQAIGARHDGRSLGTIGDLGCFSFYPGKNLGGAGEGGLIVTNDDEHAKALRALRDHGQSQRYLHERIGYNYRMDGLQALVLGHKLGHLDAWTDQRRAIATRYKDTLAPTPLKLPEIVHGDHVYHLYVVRTDRRDALKAYLDGHGIQTGLHYPIPLHRQPCLQEIAAGQSDFPVTEEFASQGLSLPMFAGMRADQQQRVIDAVLAFFDGE
ncbi:MULTISPECIES: DegT/DnrJ/EryC1/StrS family aminotransferase [unclassified Ensifer]|uniref:DegT/DnrJ/EryC1/StrS family aminotransferase n=1 Tax=unclassified Ensifer TaxID=2633371 RepID=UPI000813BBD6|nr:MULTISPECIES: DegT/DnrJ/EryC1/StrS family aminotransferase [unclassified Ensifer]OCP19869.1 erythromycin biosynthesis sensory transduction protein eryC1 [Ensifer sp. LC384]OCP20520.1 erythromycin biosynthesis sensory transduction protein eryC1 [Ensifer sp. LC54]